MQKLLIGAGILLGVAFVAAGILRFDEIVINKWQRWRYPPPQNTQVSPMGEEILRENVRQQALRAQREYKRIEAKIRQARSRGQRVDPLAARMAEAEKLIRAGQSQRALILLSVVEMQIPLEPQRITPAQAGAGIVPEKPIRARPVGKPMTTKAKPVSRTKKLQKTP